MPLDTTILDSSIDLLKTIVDSSSSQITYIGRSRDNGALTSEAKWQIQRIYVIGTERTREFADNGSYTQTWDDRASLFPTPAFLNVYSTSFNGTNSYVTMGNTHLYDVSTQFTLSFWVNPNNLTSNRCIYSKTTNDTDVYGLSIQITSAGVIFVQIRAPGYLNQYTGSIVLSALAWSHVCVTHTGSNNIDGVRVYVNGVVDSTPASGVMGASILLGQSSVLGARNVSGFFFTGYIDEVTMWGIGFNSAEVTALYNGGMPTNPTTHSQAARLDSWYRMGDGDAYPTILDNEGADDATMVNMSAASFVAVVP